MKKIDIVFNVFNIYFPKNKLLRNAKNFGNFIPEYQ